LTKSFIVDAAKVGIVSENYDAAHTDVNGHRTGIGSLWSATMTYGTVSWDTDVTIDTFGYEHETFQVNDDHYDHFIDLRYVGSGSLTAKAVDDTVAGGLDAYNLFYASTHLPNGSCNTGALDLTWNPTLDTNAGTQASDIRGYAVIVEKKVSATLFYWWIFHNCKIEATPGFSPKSATTINLSWSDARTIEFETSAATFTTHADA
jgi:hypothetical protein